MNVGRSEEYRPVSSSVITYGKLVSSALARSRPR